MSQLAQAPVGHETTVGPVNSWNEWDPLEEVIVGRLEGATIPSSHVVVTYDVSKPLRRLYPLVGGRRYPRILVDAAQRELDEFVHVLEAEGVVVRRPAVTDFSLPFSTPEWRSRGFCVSCPRDGLLVLGDEILETPMPWRSRYFEMHAYRPLLKEYFERGARWSAAPRPTLLEQLHHDHHRLPEPADPTR